MCGRFTCTMISEALAEIYGLSELPKLEARYNIAPTQQATVVREDPDGRRRMVMMKWGLIPSWAKDPHIGSKMINARCETVHEKPSFRVAIRTRRCIIPASGFYEWLRHESRMCDCPAAHPAGPAVPSAVPYEVWRRGNKSSKSPRIM